MKRFGYIAGKRIKELPVKSIIEETYTTWTLQAIYETGVYYHDYPYGIRIRNDGKVFWRIGNTTYIIDSDGTLLATLGLGIGGGASHSVLYRYTLCTSDLKDIIVQEGIGETWRRTVDDDSRSYTLHISSPLNYSYMAISPSGEWIVATVREETTNNALIFIYKGS